MKQAIKWWLLQTWRPALSLFVGIVFGSQQLLNAASANLPSGGTFAAGNGFISSSGNGLTINQSTGRGIINWSNFSIGKNGVVTFNNGSGATLNRVTGGDITTILGSLLSTGSVYILNPEGVLIGPGGSVKTGGDFVASPLKISNDAFMNGGSLLFSGTSNALVKNLGAISSTGGSVFLIGNAVENDGTISAPNGTVGLAAGKTILLKDSSSDERVSVQAAGSDITNTGSLVGAEVEVKSNGGNIYALGGNNGGQIRANGTATKNGELWLIATGGTLNLGGAVSAQNADGSGGAIETSAKTVQMASDLNVTTGKNGTWLVDPGALDIDAAAAAVLSNSLTNGTNVTETTTPDSSNAGDINVTGNILWSGNASLTLSSFGDINVMTGLIDNIGGGAGHITLRADNTGTGVGKININPQGGVFSTGGQVSLYYNPTPFQQYTKYQSPTDFSGGVIGVTPTAYMLVNNATDLQAVTTNLSGTYAMGRNIDASSVQNFTPIGLLQGAAFTGTFDGLGNVISNLNISASTTLPSVGVGLFSSNAGTVTNLGLVNTVVSSTGAAFTGMLAGLNLGTISSAYVNGKVTAATGFVGGLAGGNGAGTIQDTYSSGIVSGTYSAGLVGENNSLIETSYSTAIANYGLVGVNAATVWNSYWDIDNSGTILNGTAPGSQAVLSGAGTGLFRAQLQAGLPTGFNSGTWGGGASGNAMYPYLNWQFPNSTPIAVSGYVYADQSHSSGLSQTPVGGIVNGQVLSQTVYSGADGYYSFQLPQITLPVGTGILTYNANGNGVSFYDNLTASAAIPSMPITSGYITMQGSSPSFGALFGNLATTLNGALLPLTVALQGYDLIGMGTPIDLDASLNTQGLHLVLENFSNVTQSAAINPSDLTLLGIGSASLTDPGNAISLMAALPARGAGGTSSSATSLNIYSSQPLTIGSTSAANGLLVGGSATIQSAGALTIAPGAAVEADGAGTALVLAGSVFTNQSGSSALLAPNGSWQVWSQNPANDDRGGEAYNFKQYSATFGVTTPLGTGNGFFYTESPTLTASMAPITLQYNGSATVTQFDPTAISLNGAIDGDAVSLASGPLTVTLSDKNVGSGKSVTVNGLAAVGVNGSATVYGYQLGASLSSPGAATVTPAPIVAVTAASDKVYDGSITASGTANLNGILGNDNVGLTIGGYQFADKNAGTGKPISVTGLSLTGADAGNYSLTVLPTSASITPASLTLSFTPANKTYDATVAANATVGVLNGVIGNDQVSVSSAGQFAFADKNAGTNKTVLETGITLTGGDSGNYTVSGAPTATATISPATLTATYSANNKVYDGTVTASGSVSALAGIQGSDSVSLAVNPTLSFSDPNAGIGKSVSASGGLLTGVDSGNYVLSLSQTGSASITPAQLLYTAINATRTYATSDPTISGTVTGFVGNDTLASSTTGSLLFSSTAASLSNVGVYGVVGSGLTVPSGNYTFAQAPSNSSAFTITPLTISINNFTKLVGQPNNFTISYNGSALQGASLSTILSDLTFQTSAAAASTAGVYPITASVNNPSLSADFTIIPGTLTVTPSVTAGDTALTVLQPSLLPAASVAPQPLPATASAQLAGPNVNGFFQIGYAPAFDWNATLSAPGLLHTNALAVSSTILASPNAEAPAASVAAGVHP